MNDISAIRKEYKLKALDQRDMSPDPVVQFRSWWTEAINSDIEEVNAMTLATCNSDAQPSARIVLLKGVDETGFKFYTNYESHKASELENNPRVALVFFWKELERQVRIEGIAKRLTFEESNTYFQSRPHGSKIGAWASPQSQVIASREIVENKVKEMEKRFGSEVPCPPNWGGYVVVPAKIEFWQGRPGRLHDRLQYLQSATGWELERLAP